VERKLHCRDTGDLEGSTHRLAIPSRFDMLTVDPQLTYRCPSSFVQATISSTTDCGKISLVQQTVKEIYIDDESSINRWSFTPAHVETELPEQEEIQVLFMYECKPSAQGRDDAVATLLVFWPGQIEPTRHELRLSKFAGESYVEAFRNELNRDYCFNRYSRTDPNISGKEHAMKAMLLNLNRLPRKTMALGRRIDIHMSRRPSGRWHLDGYTFYKDSTRYDEVYFWRPGGRCRPIESLE
jgi:hypothetical protein